MINVKMMLLSHFIFLERGEEIKIQFQKLMIANSLWKMKLVAVTNYSS